MRGQPVRCLMVAFMLAVALAGVAPAVAQDQSPSLSGAKTDWIGVPPPEDCTVEPITARQFVDALKEEASDAEPLPIQVATEAELPQGSDVDDDVVDLISATLWESTACLNGGEFARFLGLFSPAGMQVFMVGIMEALGRPPGPLTAQELADIETSVTESFAAAPEPLPPDERARIDKIRDARQLPDDQVLVVVDGTIGMEGAAFAVLRLVDDRWLIESIGIIGELPEVTF